MTLMVVPPWVEYPFTWKELFQKANEKYMLWERGVSISYVTCFTCCLLSKEWTLTVQHIWLIKQNKKLKYAKGRLVKFFKLGNIVLNGSF